MQDIAFERKCAIRVDLGAELEIYQLITLGLPTGKEVSTFVRFPRALLMLEVNNGQWCHS